MSSNPSNNTKLRLIIVTQHEAMLIARAAGTARSLRPLRVDDEYQTALEQIHEFGQAIIEAFADHPHADEATLLEMIFTETKPYSKYELEVPIAAIVDLVTALEVFHEDDHDAFHDLLFVAREHWVADSNFADQ